MKPHRYPLTRTTVRLKPGRRIRLPPRFLKYTGWRPGDVLLVRTDPGQLLWTRLPDERTWRIDRLRRRTGSTTEYESSCRSLRTLGDYLALKRERSRRRDAFERSSSPSDRGAASRR